MVNRWVEHIKKFANDHNMSYGCALTDKRCKATYHNPTYVEKRGRPRKAVVEQEQPKKSRGRPKGAKNKDKVIGITIDEVRGSGRLKGSKNKPKIGITGEDFLLEPEKAPLPPPKRSRGRPRTFGMTAKDFTEPAPKKRRGRPKGSKNKPKGGMMAGVGRILVNALIGYVRGRIRERAITIALDFLRENGIDLRQYGQQVQQRFIEEVERVRQQIINGVENPQIRIPREIEDDWELVEEDPDWEIVGKRRTNGKGGSTERLFKPAVMPEGWEKEHEQKIFHKNPYRPEDPINTIKPYRPITQEQFYSLHPVEQQQHIQSANIHQMKGGKKPKWLQKVDNFVKNAGKKILKVAKNPIVQKVGIKALTTIVPELKPFEKPLEIGTRIGINEANRAVGQGRSSWKDWDENDPNLPKWKRDKIEIEKRYEEFERENPEQAREVRARQSKRRTKEEIEKDEELHRQRIEVNKALKRDKRIEEGPTQEELEAEIKRLKTEIKKTLKKDKKKENEVYGKYGVELPPKGRGRPTKKEQYYQEHNPYEHLKEGAFTKELRAFNKKHGQKYDLEQFAKTIARHPTQFKPITKKRALFYLNMIKHTPTHLD